MVKSRTKRKSSDLKVKDIQYAATMVSEYVKYWAKNEAGRLSQREIVIIPASWGFQVGKYSVRENEQTWVVKNTFDELVNTFTSKRSAVTWCILDQSMMFNTGDKLLRQDTKLSKLMQDSVNYSYTKQLAIKKKDTFMIDVLNARLAETVELIQLARIELEKTLNSAKYSVDRVLK